MVIHVEALKQQSKVEWFGPGAPTGVLYSDVMTQEAAEQLKNTLNTALIVDIRASQSNPGKVRLFLKSAEVNRLLAAGKCSSLLRLQHSVLRWNKN